MKQPRLWPTSRSNRRLTWAALGLVAAFGIVTCGVWPMGKPQHRYTEVTFKPTGLDGPLDAAPFIELHYRHSFFFWPYNVTLQWPSFGSFVHGGDLFFKRDPKNIDWTFAGKQVGDHWEFPLVDRMPASVGRLSLMNFSLHYEHQGLKYRISTTYDPTRPGPTTGADGRFQFTGHFDDIEASSPVRTHTLLGFVNKLGEPEAHCSIEIDHTPRPQTRFCGHSKLDSLAVEDEVFDTRVDHPCGGRLCSLYPRACTTLYAVSGLSPSRFAVKQSLKTRFVVVDATALEIPSGRITQEGWNELAKHDLAQVERSIADDGTSITVCMPDGTETIGFTVVATAFEDGSTGRVVQRSLSNQKFDESPDPRDTLQAYGYKLSLRSQSVDTTQAR